MDKTVNCFSVHMSDEVPSFESCFMCRPTVFYVLMDRHERHSLLLLSSIFLLKHFHTCNLIHFSPALVVFTLLNYKQTQIYKHKSDGLTGDSLIDEGCYCPIDKKDRKRAFCVVILQR